MRNNSRGRETIEIDYGVSNNRRSTIAQGMATGFFGANGVALSREEVLQDYKKKGLCPTCGKVVTHKKITQFTKGKFSQMQPINKEGEVYQGWCLKCHTMEEILDKSEVKKKKRAQKSKKMYGKSNVDNSSARSFASNSSAGSSVTRYKLKKTSTSQSSIISNPSFEDTPAQLGDKMVSSRTISVEIDEGDATEGVEISASPRGKQSIIREMKFDIDDPVAQTRGCVELASFGDDPGQTLIPAINAIVEAMSKHVEDMNLQKEAFRTLRKFTVQGGHVAPCAPGEHIEVNCDTCSTLEALGGIYPVLSAMKKYPDSRTIQREGMRVLRNCLRSSMTCKGKIVENEGIDIIICAMWVHNESPSIQEDACVALWSMGFEDDITQYRIAEKHGVAAILKGMTYYLNLENIQYHGCGALHTFSSNPSTKENILDNGGFDVIFGAMREHVHSHAVIEKALGTLVNLAIDESTNSRGASRLCVFNTNEIGTIIHALDMHATSNVIQQVACSLLEALVRSASNVKVLQKNPKSRTVLAQAARNFPYQCELSAMHILSVIEGRC